MGPVASIKKFHLASCRGGGCECLWCVDYRPLGLHGPRRRVRFRTRKEAERFVSETAHQAARGEYVAPAQIPRFGELAEDWFSSKADRRAGHRANLRASLDQHLLPAFGNTRLDQIRVESIERFRDRLRAAGYAPVTINAFLQDLGAVFKLAVRRGVCLVNPVERLERAFVGARELELGLGDGERPAEGRVSAAELLTPAELGRLVAAAAPGVYRMLLALAAATGLRSGELLALQWSDLELPQEGAGRVQVRRTLSWARVKGEEAAVRPRFYPPKTQAGRRAVPLPAPLVGALQEWRLRCPRGELELVFPTADGGLMRRSNALRYGLWPALKRAGLRRVTMHSLRHSFASALLMSGRPITEVQHLLGHSSPAVTLKVYAHFLPSDENLGTEALTQAILGPRDGQGGAGVEKWALSGHSGAEANGANRVST